MNMHPRWNVTTTLGLALWLTACGSGSPPQGSVPEGGECSLNADCGSSLLCMQGRCAALDSAPACTPGKARCSGSDVEVCGSNGRDYEFKESCVGRCSNGACVPLSQVCSPNTPRCQADNKTVEACLPDGSGYAVVQSCESSCSNGTCQTTSAAVCVPGRARCNGMEVEECKPDGTGYSYVQSCATTCSNGACVGAACKPFTLTASSASLPADGSSTVLITSSTLADGNGVPVPDGTLFTVAASSNTGGVPSADLDSATAGVQVASVNGKIDFLVKAGPGTSAGQFATVTATTLAASGCNGTINLTLVAPGTNLLAAEDFTRTTSKDVANTTASWNVDRAEVAYPMVGGFGNGEDGDLFVAAGTFNLNTQSNPANPSRLFPDAVAYKVTAFASNNTSVTLADFPAGLAPGDEVVLINLQGGSNFPSPTGTLPSGLGDTGNVGTYEVLTLKSVNLSTNQITFSSPVLKVYGATTNNATLTGQKIIVQRIPHYRNVTVSGTLTASAWTGAQGGILFIKVSGELFVPSGGELTMTGKGYRTGNTGNVTGESYPGPSNQYGLCSSVNGGGSPGGDNSSCYYGSGGSYGTAGSTGTVRGTVAVGYTYGDVQLTRWFMGSAGGRFAGDSTASVAGGIVVVWANILGVNGSISADGTGYDSSSTSPYSGGTSGGSIYLRANILNVGQNRITAKGGLGATGSNGGMGRIRMDAVSLHAGDTTSPAFAAGAAPSGPVKVQTVRLDNASGAITQARIASTIQDTRGGAVTYELSSDGGANWKVFTPGDALQSFAVAARDLRMRITLTSDGSSRPLGVQGVSIEYLVP